MISKDVILGIDTSNYTTSVALMSSSGELIANIKRPLEVKPGERGLRQSDAVFAHIKNLPSAMEEARGILMGASPVAVGVSSRPRNMDGSYMPCFLSGVASAKSIASMLNVPLYTFSHQCGHIMAALYSSGAADVLHGDFGAVHVSGGTTELLLARRTDDGFSTSLVGGTKDLNAGQVIDRIGVFLGMPFPAGYHMEKLALSYDGKLLRKKPSVEGTYMNLSGLENMAISLYKQCEDKLLVTSFVFDYIASSLVSICDNFIEKYGNMPIVFAGGVMCNSIIKARLREKFVSYFAEPMMSSDNAVGVAELARIAYLKSCK